nr:DUF6884 domain-containing protein [Niallia endozanthoxylica]
MSNYHHYCQKYAAQFFEHWVILSAKYGFLLPNDLVHSNYDVSFNRKSGEVITVDQLKQQIIDKHLDDFEALVVLGGKEYRKVVEQTFGNSYIYQYPLSDCSGIGYMIQKLKNAVLEDVEISY